MFGIYRSTRQKKLCGVLSGIAERFHLNVTLLRVLYIILLFFAFPVMLIGYFVLAVILPSDYPSQPSRGPRRRVQAKKVSDKEWSRF